MAAPIHSGQKKAEEEVRETLLGVAQGSIELMQAILKGLEDASKKSAELNRTLVQAQTQAATMGAMQPDPTLGKRTAEALDKNLGKALEQNQELQQQIKKTRTEAQQIRPGNR